MALVAALSCASMATTADSEMTVVYFTGGAAFALLFAILPVYLLIRLQVKIIVDEDSIGCAGLFGSKRIPFSKVTEFDLDRYRLKIRSKKHTIRADSTFEDIRGLTRLVEERLEEAGKTKTNANDADTCEQKVFRYARGFKWLARFILADLIVCVLLFFLARPDEFQWGWVIFMVPLVAGVPVAAYVLYRTITTVELLDDFLYWQRGRRTVSISYDAIEEVIVKKTWNGFQYLEIRYNGQRLCLSGALVPFDRLVARLSQRAPVSWAGNWPLRFPVVMKGSSALESVAGVITGLLFGALSLYLLASSSPVDFVMGIFGVSLSVAFVASVILFQFTYDAPRRIQFRRRKIIFGKRRFVVVDWFKCHTFRAHDVTDVYFRVDNSFSTTYVLEISLGERRLVFQNFGHDVPLLPLYQLLCRAYYPQGYRDPFAGEGTIPQRIEGSRDPQ
jgi:hypothetical protein